MSVTCITDYMGIEGCIGPNGKCVQRQQAFCRATYMILHKACSIQPPQTETDKRKEGNVHTSPTLVPPARCAKFQHLENRPWDDNVGNVVVPWVCQMGCQILKRSCSWVCNCLHYKTHKSQKGQATCKTRKTILIPPIEAKQ